MKSLPLLLLGGLGVYFLLKDSTTATSSPIVGNTSVIVAGAPGVPGYDTAWNPGITNTPVPNPQVPLQAPFTQEAQDNAVLTKALSNEDDDKFLLNTNVYNFPVTITAPSGNSWQLANFNSLERLKLNAQTDLDNIQLIQRHQQLGYGG